MQFLRKSQWEENSHKLDLLLGAMENISRATSKPKPDSLELLRHQLGSIDLSDVKEDEEMTEADRRDYCAAISAVFPRLEKDIKKFLHAQLLFASNEAVTWEQVIFGRGTFNGIDLLLQEWKKAHEENMEKSKPKEDFDRNNPIGEFSERST